MNPERIRWSAKVMATAASMAGTALGTTQGSCLPLTLIEAFSIEDKLTVFCSFAIDGVGLIATRIMMGMPLDKPPNIPPAFSVEVNNLPIL